MRRPRPARPLPNPSLLSVLLLLIWLTPLAMTACGDRTRDGDMVAAEPAPLVEDALFELGQALFFDKELSGNRDVACATCHHPGMGTDDDLSLSLGAGGQGLGAARVGGQVIARNSPALFNLHLAPNLFWDGRIDRDRNGRLVTPAGAALTPEMAATLTHGVVAAQAMFPVVSHEEMRGAPGTNELAEHGADDHAAVWSALMARLGRFPEYIEMFEAAYPGERFETMTFAHAANAIAAYELRAFEAVDSRFQRFLEGDERALSELERRGMRVFFDECGQCHGGPALSDFRHHNTGLAQIGPGAGHGTDSTDDHGRAGVTGRPEDRYAFRTPSLLNVELTAPYGHAGQFDDLRAFVRHYADAERQLREYRVEDHVADASLHGTQVDNVDAILETLDRDVRRIGRFDVDAVTAFLESTTADSARNLVRTMPARVPSGLPVE